MAKKKKKGGAPFVGQMTWFDLIEAEPLLIPVDSLWFGPRRALIILWKSDAWLLECLMKLFIAHHQWWNHFLQAPPPVQPATLLFGIQLGSGSSGGKEEDEEQSGGFNWLLTIIRIEARTTRAAGLGCQIATCQPDAVRNRRTHSNQC